MLRRSVRVIELWVAFFLLIAASAVLLFAKGQFVARFAPYAVDEPHHLVPTLHAAIQKEWRLRCADQNAVGVSACNSQSVVMDSALLRVAMAFRPDRNPSDLPKILLDPEWTDPYLQWALVMVRVLTTLILLSVCFFLLRHHVGAALGALTLLSLMLTPNMAWRSASLTPDGPMALGILLGFLLLLQPTRLRWHHGILLAFVATIKLAIPPFLALSLPNWKAALAFLLTYTALMWGLFTSTNEIMSVFSTLLAMNEREYSTATTFLALLWTNLTITVNGAYWALPFFFIGLTRLRISRNEAWRWVGLGILILLALKSKNNQPRYFLGLTAIYLSIGALGLEWLLRKTPRLIQRALPAVGLVVLIFVIGLQQRGDLVQNLTAIRDYFKKGRQEYSNEEKFILEQVEALRPSAEKPLFIDTLVRANPWRHPLASIREAVRTIHPFQESAALIPGATLITLCYPLNDARAMGIESFAWLEPEIKRQCQPDDIFSLERLNLFHNLRVVPIRSYGGGKIIAVTIPNKPVLQPLKLIDRDKIFPRFFKTDESWIQEWGGSHLTTREVPFHLSFALRSEPRSYRIQPIIRSNFRTTGSKLRLLADGQAVGECDLATRIDYQPPVFRDLYARWRTRHYPVECEFRYSGKRGPTHFEFVVESGASEEHGRSIKWHSVDFEAFQ